jgi:hypothetical protein
MSLTLEGKAMSILQKHLLFVKEQVEFQTRMITKYAGNPFREKLHSGTRGKFEALYSDLEIADRQLDGPQSLLPESHSGPIRLSLGPKDVEGLPEELLKELSISEGDKTEFAILQTIEEAGGVVSLDRILIELYRKTGEIMKRAGMTSKLYRMGQKGLVFSVPTKKGVYSNRDISEAEARTLFGEQ